MGAGTDLKISKCSLRALGSIINGGTLYTPKMVLGLSDADGNMVESYRAGGKGQSVTAETAAQIKAVMESRAQTDGVAVAGYSTGAMCGYAHQYKDEPSCRAELFQHILHMRRPTIQKYGDDYSYGDARDRDRGNGVRSIRAGNTGRGA